MRTVILLAAVLLAPTSYAQKNKTTAKAPAAKLTNTEFPDGTGNIGLPAGWQINESYRGQVICRGTIAGQGAVMGFASHIGNPDWSGADLLINSPTLMPIAKVYDLGGAIRSILTTRKCRLLSLRSRPAPPLSPGIPAAYYLYEYINSEGKKISALGFFTALPYANGLPNWDLFSSYVNAPSERFMKDLPTLMAMWNSYRPSGLPPKAGSNGAMIDATLKENYVRNAATMAEQRAAWDRMQEKFKETIMN